MADAAVVDPPPPQPSDSMPRDNSKGLSTSILNDDDAINFNQEDTDVLINGFDLYFDDLLPASLSPPPHSDEAAFESDGFILPGSDSNLIQFAPDRCLKNAFKATVMEFPEDLHGDGANSNSLSSPEPEVFQSSAEQGMHESNGDRGQDVSGYLNMPSAESSGSKGSSDPTVLNYPSPESEGSENCRSDLSGKSINSVNSSPNFGNFCPQNVGIAQKKQLENSNNKSSESLLKRKKDGKDSNNSDSRTNKFQKSAYNLAGNANYNSEDNIVLSEEEEKRKNRLMRNRESAQLSRQRKKRYVEELQDKVKSMGAAIQDLNSQIAYVMAENATLRQQLSGGRVPPPTMAPPPPGVYPPQMMYPWMPYAMPPYMMKSQGSQVPLVPIPRLKSQQSVSPPKASKKPESKKAVAKTKKVASVSFLGFLLFIMLFGGLVPMVNIKYGGVSEAVNGVSKDVSYWSYQKHHERVLSVSGNMNRAAEDGRIGGGGEFSHSARHDRIDDGGELDMRNRTNEHVPLNNGSVPLAASLYVPRNDKLVKIDGSLIIHSVLARERAMASHDDPAKRASAETRLAVPEDLAPAVQVSDGKQSHLNKNPSDQPSRLPQWFREGLAGPMLSSEMCTEVFQFDVSSAIVPSAPTRNKSVPVQSQNYTDLGEGKNRRTSAKARILHGLPASHPGSPRNITDAEAEKDAQDNFSRNGSLPSMVVSVLVDPREVDDIDGNGVMGPKTLSRIFVVVLMDSVKYVTYSCILPFKGAVSHLVAN